MSGALRVLRHRLRALFRRGEVDRELDDEIRLHIDLQTEANLRAGMPPEEARRRARLQFGGMEGHKEESRRAQGLELKGFQASWLDFKLGLRMLVKYPGLTLVGGLALMVATGLGAAFFQFTENMTRPRLPFEGGDRLVLIQNWDLAAADPEHRSLHDFATWREEIRTVEELGAVQIQEQAVTTAEGETELLDVARISPSAFRVTGAQPLLGQPLVEEHEQPDAPPVVVIGYRVWQRLFRGDPGVIGQTLRVGATTATVVGVMPEDYGFPVNHSIWTPLRVDGTEYQPRQGPPIRIFGRLRRGVSLEEAQAELSAVGARAATDSPETHEQLQPQVMLFANSLVMDPEMRWAIRGIRLLFVLLMMVMCVNVATLVFARTAAREGEFAVRSALGASRRRIVLQLFVEALALTLVAAGLGLLAAWWGLRRGMQIFWEVQEEAGAPFWWVDSLLPGTIAYALVLAVVGAAMVGIVPALKITGRRVQPTLSQISAGSPRLRFGGVWTVVVVLQVALSVAFLPVAVMGAKSALQDAERTTGFAADAYLTGELRRELDVPLYDLPEAERGEVLARSAELQEEVKRRVAALPGVASVTVASRLSGMNHILETIHVADVDLVPPDTAAGPNSRNLAVDLDFFESMNATVVSGRAFHSGDVASGGSVIVNEAFVRDVMNGRDPVGQRIRYPRRRGEDGERWHEVVGVVSDLEMDSYGPGAHRAIYHPLRPGLEGPVHMFVRVGSQAAVLEPRVRSTINDLDPSLRLGELRTVREVWEPVHRSGRIFAAVLALVALIALLLSMAGIHALMSFAVSQRTREIGVRTALGAGRVRIVRTIFSRAFAQLAAGVLLGSAVAALVWQDELATDGPLVLFVIVTTMLIVGLLACLLPARRALRIQPTEAMKSRG